MHTVKIIMADAGQTAAYADKIISEIPQYYASRYRSIKKKQEADQELTAGFLLRKYLNVSRDAQLIRTEYGKPMLQSGKTFFNIAHSGIYVVLAVADIEIGVDIEKLMDVHWLTVGKIFSEKQQKRLEQTPKKEQPQLFTRIWTEWEAELKLLGTGFAAIPEHAETVSRIVHSIRYGDYMITCAAYEEFYASVEENVLWPAENCSS